MNFIECITHNEKETEALGKQLATVLLPGIVVALFGDLASGKTCFTRGMARYLSDKAPVHSPTFTLVNEYEGKYTLYHLDLYRLNSPEELLTLGYEDLVESRGICVIEWAERAAPLLPNKRINVYFEHAGGDMRRLRFENQGISDDVWQTFAKHCTHN